MASMDRWAPRSGGVNKPDDHKMKNGMFHQWPKSMKFGGKQGGGHPSMRAKDGMNAAGPISDRGKGR